MTTGLRARASNARAASHTRTRRHTSHPAPACAAASRAHPSPPARTTPNAWGTRTRASSRPHLPTERAHSPEWRTRKRLLPRRARMPWSEGAPPCLGVGHTRRRLSRCGERSRPAVARGARRRLDASRLCAKSPRHASCWWAWRARARSRVCLRLCACVVLRTNTCACAAGAPSAPALPTPQAVRWRAGPGPRCQRQRSPMCRTSRPSRRRARRRASPACP